MLWPPASIATTHIGDIEYHDIGSGPVIVFLHLVLADASHWDLMPALLADRYRCIFPTLPMGGHRIPANEGADLSVDGLVGAVAQLLEHLDLRDITLVGNDSGGALAQVMAATNAARVGRVVLTNCDMYDTCPPNIFSYFKLLPYVPGSLWITGRALKVRALWRLPFVFGLLTNRVDGVKINRWADALLASKAVRRDAKQVIRGLHPRVTNAAAVALHTTTLPFLLAWGSDDKAFKPALARRFCAEVPTARLVLIEHCKTLVCWDQPQRLAELIDGFVTSGS